MSLFETYIANIRNVRKENPDAEIIEVTRSKDHVLSPSWVTLNRYKHNQNWDEYIERFLKEMQKPECIKEMARIAVLSKTKDVYICCFEKKGHCHRFLLMDMINTLLYQLWQIKDGNGYKYPELCQVLKGMEI